MGGREGRRATAPTPPSALGSPQPAGPEDEPVDVWAVVRRAQEGDSQAFGELYDRYVGPVYRFLYYRLGNPAQAEDFTSETFLRALRRLESLRFQGRDPGAWFMTIARNIVLDHVKSSRHRLEVLTDPLEHSRTVDARHAVEGPEDAVVNQLDGQTLLRHLQELGGEQRECVVLRFLQDLTVSETAAVMGRSDGAIKALQHRALRRLATLLRQDTA